MDPEGARLPGAVLGKNIWGPGPQALIQKCGLGVECRRHSNGGAEGVDGGGVWEGVSPSKWCILMHSGARFRPTRPITAIMMFMTSI